MWYSWQLKINSYKTIDNLNNNHFTHLNIMEKRCRPEAGHFKQLNDIQLPKVKKRRVERVTVLPDDYIIERIVAKRQRERKMEYLVNWAGYRPEEATWEPAAHIPTWLLEDFEKPSQDEALICDSRERLSLTFERGLKARLVADFNLEMKPQFSAPSSRWSNLRFHRRGKKSLKTTFAELDFSFSWSGPCQEQDWDER